jgi:hypothetical protein
MILLTCREDVVCLLTYAIYCILLLRYPIFGGIIYVIHSYSFFCKSIECTTKYTYSDCFYKTLDSIVFQMRTYIINTRNYGVFESRNMIKYARPMFEIIQSICKL